MLRIVMIGRCPSLKVDKTAKQLTIARELFLVES